MKKVLLTGSEGFIGGYVVKELLDQGYKVVGIDNLSKYGQVIRNHSDDSNYEFVEGDVKDRALIKKILKECDYLIAGAAMIGSLQKGIEWFNPSNTLAAQTYMIIFIILFIQFKPRGIFALKGRAAED